MITFEAHSPRAQGTLDDQPFDRWITADGDVAAQFFRCGPQAYMVRFSDQADFSIRLEASGEQVSAFPVPGLSPAALDTLYRNAIVPVIANHHGGLFLHGSAVALSAHGHRGAVAFMGLSRRGKTTLAGAFAAAGHPFLSEDTVALEHSDAQYLVQPMRPVLRVFHDSASFLLGNAPVWDDPDAKSEVDASGALPFANIAAPLRHIFLLGPGEADDVRITRLGEAQAIAQLMQQAFVLDVEDKARLRAHFERVAALASAVPCHMLDYPRRYDQLARVIAAIEALGAG